MPTQFHCTDSDQRLQIVHEGRASNQEILRFVGGEILLVHQRVTDSVRVTRVTVQSRVALPQSIVQLACSGLINPDTNLGENARHEEVSDEQATSYVFP